MDVQANEEQRDLEREYLDFLDDEVSESLMFLNIFLTHVFFEGDERKYSELVKNMIAERKNRLLVNINDLRRKNPKRAARLLNNAFEEQLAFQRALKEYVYTVSGEYAKEFDDFFVAFEGSFGSKHVTPRNLNARYLGNLVCVEGIVTKCKCWLSFFKQLTQNF